MNCRLTNILKQLFFCTLLLLFVGCNPTKYVAENELLLRKVSIKSDVEGLKSDYLDDYLHQNSNTWLLGVFRPKLGCYNLSDTASNKWIDRYLRKIGQPPVIYDPQKTIFSEQELQKVLFNKGYLNGEVISDTTIKDRQVTLSFRLKGNEPYTISRYIVTLPDSAAQEMIEQRKKNTYLHSGDLFDVDVLNNERERVATILRNHGYYNFRKELLCYSVDSALGNNQIDAELSLQPYLLENDSALNMVFKVKTVENIFIFAIKDNKLNFSPADLKLDTTYIDGYTVITDKEDRSFNPKALVGVVALTPNKIYRERDVNRTYTLLNRISSVKYVNITFAENKNDNLNAYIVVTQGKPHNLSAELEASYSGGDLGFKAGVGYQNNNIFHNFETLSLSANGGYEAIGALNQLESAWEAGGNVSLSFPKLLIPSTANFKRRSIGQTDISVYTNFQTRPEYNRIVFGASFKYGWQYRRWNFNFSLIDLSFIYLPYISERFREKYMKPSSSIRFSYEDNLIMRWGLSISHSSLRNNSQTSSYYTFRTNIATAGNLLYGFSVMCNPTKFKSQEHKEHKDPYTIFKIAYAQFAKVDVDYAYNQFISENARLVFHAGLGVAVPYCNSSVLPFEARYYAGGANGMRGWAARTLGPGNFHNSSCSIDFMRQSGDIKLDLNIEARFKLFWKIHAAIFADAGNIWTIRQYKEQPTGEFRFDQFYKQIGLNYGVGLRADFSYFVIRVDMGIKLYDPGYPVASERWRTDLTWKDDFALHFAVGYPF